MNSSISFQATLRRTLSQWQDTVYPLLMNVLMTARLRLMPATADLIRLEIGDRTEFFAKLGVAPIPDWPSPVLADVLSFFLLQLESHPSLVGWLSWYWILTSSRGDELVGGGGFKGSPVEGAVEIGYEIRPAHRRSGLATEAVDALVGWALSHADVECVMAETMFDNLASLALLRKLDFVHAGDGSEAGLLRFVRTQTS